MSTILINGRPYAAGLYWLERAGPAATARAARRFARPWCVHRAGQTGYAGGGEDGPPEGLPALAPALLELIESDFWMALVAGDAATGNAAESGLAVGEAAVEHSALGDNDVGAAGDTGRFLLIKVRDGAVLADGDEVFTNRDAAVEAFRRARALGWDLYATPGLLAGGADRDVTDLDVARLAAAPENVLRRAPFTRIGRGRLALALLLPAAVAGVWIAWLQRDAVLDWIAGPEPVVAAAPPTDPDLAVAVDSAALIEACRRALIDYPPWLPAWRIESLACVARFSDPELAALRPELAGRAVMLARWRLGPGHAEPLHRQLAEEHLSRWYAASVVDARAWAVVPLAPVLRIAKRAPTSFLALRRAVDRGLGISGAWIEYARGPQGSWTVEIGHPGPLPGLAGRLRAFADTAGLEITALDRGADGSWCLHGRPVAPEAMARAEFRELTRAPDHGPPRDSEHDPEQGGER